VTIQEQYVAFKTIVIKEVLRFMRIWLQTVVPPVITAVLYFIIFGNLIGSQLGDIDGVHYTEYIVPGLILMAVISNSYANVVTSVYGSKFHRHIEEMLISPIPNYIIVLGFIAGGVARGLTVGIAVSVVSIYFADLAIYSIVVMVGVVVLTAMLFSLGGFINGIFAKSFDDISIIPTFVLTPLTYLGGIFYSIKILPQFWQQVSEFNPILYMVNAFRFSILGVTDIDLQASFIIIVGFIVMLYLVSLYLLRKGIGIKT
jgi:ABC-2 type transport system permease protein